MINFDFANECYQCGNCKNICPKGAIQYIENDTGDFIPKIDESKCIGCNLCEKICPHINAKGTNKFVNVVSAYGEDASSIKRSASGGVFWTLAKKFLDDGGYICGCVLQDNLKAEHILSNSIDDLIRMQGSKYVKSNTENVLPKIEECLREGNKIMFCGTPCQVAAIEKRFERYREQLYLIGLFCHGIPSQKVFDVYVEWLEKQNNKKIQDVIFRSKNHPQKEHEVVFEDHSHKFYYKNESTYMCFFWGGMVLNTCAEPNCQYKNNFCGDLMIGDAWGYQGKLTDQYDGRISNIICLTQKGVDLIHTDDLVLEQADIAHIYKYQPYLKHGSKKNEMRDKVLHELNATNYKKIIYKYHLSSRKRDIAYKLGLYPVIIKMKKLIKGK